MKLGLLCASAILALSGLSLDAHSNNTGGSVLFEFNDVSEMESFSAFTEYGNTPYILDGRLYTNVMAEQKLILNDYNFSNVIVETEVHAINPLGKIDAGIYFDASIVENKLDGIDAYCLNIEHDVDRLTYRLKLHSFKKSEYVGCLAESKDIKYVGNSVSLKMVISDNVVTAYTDGKDDVKFTYELEGIDQKIGLRGYYSPSYFEYFKVTANAFEKDLTKFNDTVAKARAIDLSEYTASSSVELVQMLEELESVDVDTLNQLEVDALVKRLTKCMDNLVIKHTLSELNELVQSAQQYINEDEKYTVNSIESVKFCVNEASKITEDDEDVVSYWYNMLTSRINALVRYAKYVE